MPIKHWAITSLALSRYAKYTLGNCDKHCKYRLLLKGDVANTNIDLSLKSLLLVQ